MKTKIKKTSMVEKWEVKYEDDFTISIWKYNSKISRVNPYEVTVEYKGDTETKKKRSTRKKTN
jgi:hypothetical protein